jgi:hypothetical protein
VSQRDRSTAQDSPGTPHPLGLFLVVMMPAKFKPMPSQQKITFGEMRASGARRVIVHCGDYKCGHSVTMYTALWPDTVRLSDLEERFVCTVCSHRGADVRPLFEPSGMGTDA